MKLQRIILIASLSAIAIWAMGQDTITHVVQRGETIEYIAQTHGITIDELSASNNDMSQFYTGLTIRIPPKKEDTTNPMANVSAPHTISNVRLQAYMDECAIADKLFEDKEYRKAQKKYKQIIHDYGNELPCTEALYSNALCSYNREKWKSAIGELSAVIGNPYCSSAQRNHCKQLMSKAVAYRDQQLENRANLWGGLLMTAAAVGTSVAMAKSQPRNSTSVGGMQGGGTSYSSSESSTMASSGSSSSGKSTCPSLKIGGGKWYCANTGRCGMCNGDGKMDAGFGNGVNNTKCTLCGGSGKCKYCQ